MRLYLNLFFISFLCLAILNGFRTEIKIVRTEMQESKNLFKGKLGKALNQKKNKIEASTNLKKLIEESQSIQYPVYKDWPVISLWLTYEDQYGLQGIVKNRLEHGPMWEKMGYVEYFENGINTYKSKVGVRLHGGSSRRAYPSSYRIYFSKKYGKTSFLNEFKFENKFANNLKKIVLHREKPLHFLIDFTYWFTREVGGYALETKPVIFYLNGKLVGHYYLIQHLSHNYIKRELGHKDFYFYRYKSSNSGKSALVYQKMYDEITSAPAPLKAKYVKKYVDLENLVNSIIPFIYLSVNDWYQGMAVMNRNESKRWYWINWDMDRAFAGNYYIRKTKKMEKPKCFSILSYNNRARNDIRSIIFRRLITEDPDFKLWFKKYFKDTINKISENDIKNRFSYYRILAKSAFLDVEEHLAIMEDFLSKRKEIVFSELDKL
jgi:hypothetical protein